MEKEFMDFLLPSLNLVYDLTVLGDIDESLNLIAYITDISRYYAKSENDVVKLKDEIKIIEKYLYIQSLRSNKCLKYEILNNIPKTTYINRKQYFTQFADIFISKIDEMGRVKKVAVIFEMRRKDVDMKINVDYTEKI